MNILGLIKENRVLVAGLVLPAILVVFFTIAKGIPDRTVPNPEFKVVYAIQPWNGEKKFMFKVTETGKLEATYLTPKTQNPYTGTVTPGRIYIFTPGQEKQEEIVLTPPDVKEGDEKTSVAYEKLSNVTLSDQTTAPDGYQFENTRYNNYSLLTDIFSYHNRDYGPALTKDGRVIPLPKTPDVYGDVTFIGWITSEKAGQ
jgi:hypothetical protein